MSADIVKSLSQSLELLRNAIASTNHICVSGPTSSGKTTLVKKVFEERSQDYIHAYIPCELVPTSSTLFIEIYKSLLENSGLRAKIPVPDKVWNLGDFVHALAEFQRIAKRGGIKRLFMVLDRFDTLRGSVLECVASLVTMPDISLIIITTTTIQEVQNSLRPYDAKTQLDLNCTQIYVSPWDQQDIIDTILKHRPKRYKKLYKKFVNNVVRIFYISKAKDFVELRTFCQEKFKDFLPFYVEKRDEFIRKYLKMGQDFVVDEDLAKEYDISQILPGIMSAFLTTLKDDTFCKSEAWRLDNEVDRTPEISTAMLIIACYVAATTTPSDDKKNFVKAQKRKTSRHKTVSNNYVPLKAFTFERLLHVHKGLMHMHYGHSLDQPHEDDFLDKVLESVLKLEELQMIQLTIGTSIDPTSRFKLTGHLTRSYVNRLAKTIEFEIDHINGLD